MEPGKAASWLSCELHEVAVNFNQRDLLTLQLSP